jgi:hypothetical protein
MNNELIPASHLRETAEKKQAEIKDKMDSWVEETATAIIGWCRVDAEEGKFSSVMEMKDFNNIFTPNISKENYSSILFKIKVLLEKYGYQVSIDDFDPQTKSQGTVVYSISIEW